MGALVLVLGAAWLVVTALLARSELGAVRHELPELRHALSSGDFDHASTIARRLERHARRAHGLTSGPVWALAAGVPGLGQPAQTARILSRQSERLGARVLPGVLDLGHELSAATLRHGAHIDLAQLVRAVPVLEHAANAATTASAAVARAPAHTWLGGVDNARSTVLGQLGKVANQLSGAAGAIHTLLPMLGQSGLQRYFLAFENEAESRGLGGLPGAFAIVTAEHGTLAFTHFENDDVLRHVHVDVDLGADFQRRYRAATPTQNYGDSDMSPHFPDAARIWAAMWAKKSGEHIDAALAIDPTALSYLLAVTGPATLPGGQRISAHNVVALTQKDQYKLFTTDAARKKYLVELAGGVSHQLLAGGGGDTQHLVRAAARAARERRLVVWSADPAVETSLVRFGYAGVLRATGAPFAGFVVASAASGKLDYYLDRSMTYRRTGCGSASVAIATFTMTNRAPAKGLPPYVTIRLDNPPAGYKPGDNRLSVTYFASAGAVIRSISINGKPVRIASGTENGLVAVSTDIELPLARSRTMTVTVLEPAATAALQVLRQPLVRPIKVSVAGDRCG